MSQQWGDEDRIITREQKRRQAIDELNVFFGNPNVPLWKRLWIALKDVLGIIEAFLLCTSLIVFILLALGKE